MGTACENKTSTRADQQKDKVENVQIENKQSNEESSYDESEYDRAILEMENEQITRDSIKLVEEIKKIEEEGKKIDADSKRIAKNRKKARAEMESLWASVDEEVFKSSKEVQNALDEYFQWAKENWYEPIPHAKYLASLKK